MVPLPTLGSLNHFSKLPNATLGAAFFPPLIASQRTEKAVAGSAIFMPLISTKWKGGTSCEVKVSDGWGSEEEESEDERDRSAARERHCVL